MPLACRDTAGLPSPNPTAEAGGEAVKVQHAVPGSLLCNSQGVQQKHKENPPQIPTDYTNSGPNSPKHTYSFPAIFFASPTACPPLVNRPFLSIHLCPKSSVSLATLSLSTKATQTLPCSKESPTHLAYLWPTWALLLPPIPFPLPIPAQQLLLSRCSSRPALLLPPPVPVSLLTPPSLSLRNSTWFSHPSTSFLEHFPSSALLSHLRSSHLHSPRFPSTHTEELLLFPSSPFLGI